jgi:hypothetical protein
VRIFQVILRCKASAAGTDNSDAENHSEPSAPPQASAGQSAGQSVTLTPSTTQDNKSIQEKGGSGQSWWPYSMLRRTL